MFIRSGPMNRAGKWASCLDRVLESWKFNQFHFKTHQKCGIYILHIKMACKIRQLQLLEGLAICAGVLLAPAFYIVFAHLMPFFCV